MKIKCRNSTRWHAPIDILAALVAVVPLLSGCQHTTYSNFQGTGPVQGQGGTVRIVEGIEIWENGTPDRRYSILGVSDQQRKGSSDKKYDKELSKIAQEHGGNAVVIVSETPVSGSKSMVKAQIVRYEQ
jgi:hypothetical protein